MVFLSTIITSANTHDVTAAIDTVDSMVIKRQSSSSSQSKHNKKKQNLYLDKAYIIPKKQNKKLSREDIFHIYDTE